jgi:hypothetical protein
LRSSSHWWGVAAYFLVESRKVLPPTEAAAAVRDILNAQAPPTVSFHTGLVKDGYYESPRAR